jgi:large subunit ribosomal protein L28
MRVFRPFRRDLPRDDGMLMAQVCEVCSKKTAFGHNVSHAHNVTNRIWRPNLQRVRIRTEKGGTKRIRICTRCLRSGKVQKAVS